MTGPCPSPDLHLSPLVTSLVAPTPAAEKVVDLHEPPVGRDLIGHRGSLYVSGADKLTESQITRSAGSACP